VESPFDIMAAIRERGSGSENLQLCLTGI